MEYHANGRWWCITACDMHDVVVLFHYMYMFADDVSSYAD